MKFLISYFVLLFFLNITGAILASPTTPEIQTEMRNIINTSNPEYEIFTGIHATFSQGDYYTTTTTLLLLYYCYLGTPLSDIPVTWAKNEPDNKDNKEKCITLNGIGESADHRCEDTRPYICYRSGKFQTVNACGTDDPEYNLDKRTNKCYKFHTVPRNFSRAFMACSAEGGHLAIANSELEATVLKELFAKYPNVKPNPNVSFVGFHDWGEKLEFRTIHGQTLTEAGYNVFPEGEPNDMPPGESCGAILHTGLFNDLWCDKVAAFICEKNPGYPDVCRAGPE